MTTQGRKTATFNTLQWRKRPSRSNPPPKVKRANREIEPTPDRKEGADNGDETNHVTPAKEEPKLARENKDPKRTKMQTLDSYLKI